MLVHRTDRPSFSSSTGGRELQNERRALQPAVARDVLLLQLHQLKAGAEGAFHLRRDREGGREGGRDHVGGCEHGVTVIYSGL